MVTNLKRLLVANRGEVAVRVIRAAAEAGVETIAVYSEDDARSSHVAAADTAVLVAGQGPSAYLDADSLIAAARDGAADSIHPGYGFLSESADFATACDAGGLVFVGPSVESLAVFGDKARARRFAEECSVPVLAAESGPVSAPDVHKFFETLVHSAGPDAAVMLKARHGGGGRGMRRVLAREDIDAAYARCQSEARTAFGSGELYVEQLVRRARHIEVQVAGDGREVIHLGERECTLQRRHQKLIEVAPSPRLGEETRRRLVAAAVRIAAAAGLRNLATVEFLVDADDESRIAFIEVNPRLQVEHTVTEEAFGIDLVRLQLHLAGGSTLAELELFQERISPPSGYAIQCRINTESISSDGRILPTAGTLSVFHPPGGPGLRTDTHARSGYVLNGAFDSLLAKLIAHCPGGTYAETMRRLLRGLVEFRIEGVATNRGFLEALIRHPKVLDNDVTTEFVEHFIEENGAELAVGPAGKVAAQTDAAEADAPLGAIPIAAPMQGTVVSLEVDIDDLVAAGHTLLVMEAMKMEHEVTTSISGRVVSIAVQSGDTVAQGQALVMIVRADVTSTESHTIAIDLDSVRPDLAEVRSRHALGLDEQRPKAVEKRRKLGRRTARENIADLVDKGSFQEYGSLVFAAQRARRSVEDLMANTPADGLVTGVGSINGDLFGEHIPARFDRAAVVAYDYTVLAGTQGAYNHKKKDRIFELAEEWHLPVVIFAEGGGGRPGDTDFPVGTGLDCLAFRYFAQLSALVPLVGINGGYCFAGNAALVGCCDVVIATRDSNLGMGGPAMIEGGGLGVYPPREIGPIHVQSKNGVVDVVVADEREAVAIAKQYLSYFQGPLAQWECVDQRYLRHAIPENRLRIYDVRKLIDQLCDSGSVLEVRRTFAHGMVTALARIEGRPLGVIANNPVHLGGAIDSDGADKAARFMQLCDAFDLPILFLCDTPGIMVGPEAEKSGTVRHASRMFVTAASMTVPFFTIVLRKGYGLGAQAMAGGSFRSPFFTVAWPTGEFGGMGLEGAVKLGFRAELERIEDSQERQALYEKLVAASYARGKAINVASLLEIDEVIDPAETRAWVVRGLSATATGRTRSGKKRPCIDPW